MTDISRRALLGAAGVATAGTAIGVGTGIARAASPRPVAFRAWEGAGSFADGTRSGIAIDDDGRLVIDGPSDTIDYTDPHTDLTRSYDVGAWTSPAWSPGFAATAVIPSWNATTPPGTWVEVAVRGTTDSGATTTWYVLGRWTSGDGDTDILRTSVGGQADDHADVNADILRTRNGTTLDTVQVRVRLCRPEGASESPRVSLLTACASALPEDATVPVSPGAGAAGTVLDLPTYSQQMHLGHYPQWNGGGEAWCSPTSTAMVLDHFELGPPESVTRWVDIPGETRPQVDHLARSVFDHAFDGAGNWTFNTAYAGARGARAFVTRLRSLAEAERFVEAGLPLVCSVSFTADELDGAGYSTNGHLLVLVGFDADGDVVVNDPASHEIADDDEVRVTYRREQFENVWVPRSGGVVYVIAPPGHALPEVPDADEPNWG